MDKIAMITMDVEVPHLYRQESMDQFLDILKEFDFRATFFITRGIIEKFPSIIGKLVELGHEMASHGCSDPITVEEIDLLRLPTLEIDKVIEKSKLFLEERGVNPLGIRLPAFQWNKQVLDIVSKFFKYDSSVSPNFFGKNPNLDKFNSVNLIHGRLVELPISRINYLNLRVGTPIFLRAGAKNLIRIIKMFGYSSPLLFYCHSFDLVDINIDRLVLKGWKKTWYHNQCGPLKSIFFRTFFGYLKDEKFEVVRCMDFVNRIESERNRHVQNRIC